MHCQHHLQLAVQWNADWKIVSCVFLWITEIISYRLCVFFECARFHPTETRTLAWTTGGGFAELRQVGLRLTQHRTFLLFTRKALQRGCKGVDAAHGTRFRQTACGIPGRADTWDKVVHWTLQIQISRFVLTVWHCSWTVNLFFVFGRLHLFEKGGKGQDTKTEAKKFPMCVWHETGTAIYV